MPFIPRVVHGERVGERFIPHDRYSYNEYIKQNVVFTIYITAVKAEDINDGCP